MTIVCTGTPVLVCCFTDCVHSFFTGDVKAQSKHHIWGPYASALLAEGLTVCILPSCFPSLASPFVTQLPSPNLFYASYIICSPSTPPFQLPPLPSCFPFLACPLVTRVPSTNLLLFSIHTTYPAPPSPFPFSLSHFPLFTRLSSAPLFLLHLFSLRSIFAASPSPFLITFLLTSDHPVFLLSICRPLFLFLCDCCCTSAHTAAKTRPGCW